MPTRVPRLLGLIPFISLMTGCAGCVGTGGHLVTQTPNPPTPVSEKIYNSDIHLINESGEDLRDVSVSVRSAFSGANHSRTLGDLANKGYVLLPSGETRWYLVEGEVLTVEAEGHSPTTFTVHLRGRVDR